MAHRSIERVVRRAARDHVVTCEELVRLSRIGAVRRDPAAAVRALDAVEHALSTGSVLRLAACKEALAVGETGRILDILRGVVAPASRLPAWVPAGFDFTVLARRLSDLLRGQGEPAARLFGQTITRLVISDADLTLLDSVTPVRLAHKDTGELLRLPGASDVLHLGVGPERDFERELAALERLMPELPWSDYVLDFSLAADERELARASVIEDNLRELWRANADPQSRAIINTARSAETAPAAIDAYLRERRARADGIIAVNAPSVLDALGLRQHTLTDAQRKALVNAGLVVMYGKAHVRTLEFLDDNDANLVASMQLLPRMFPRIFMRFCDVVHTGGGSYRQRLVATTTRTGELATATGERLRPSHVAEYRGRGVPFVPDPRYVEPAVLARRAEVARRTGSP